MKRRRLILVLAALAVGSVVAVVSFKRINPNTLTTELFPSGENSLVVFRVLIKIGSANDPTGKEGLCRLAWSLLADGGSRTRTSDEIAAAFFPMAAALSPSVDKEMSAFSGTIHRDNLDAYYALVRDMLLDPGFREEDFNRLKFDQLDSLEKTLISDKDEQFGSDILSLMLAEGHPYGHLEAGTVESVKNITLDEVKAFYADNFVQGNLLLGLAGGYPAGFPDRIRADFARLPATFTPRLVLPELKRPLGIEFVVAEKEMSGAAMAMGFPLSITREDKDYWALGIAAADFGDYRRPESLVLRKTGEEGGLNETTTAGLEHFVLGRDGFPEPNHARQKPYFFIQTRTGEDADRLPCIRRTLNKLRLLVEEGIPEDRFELIRAYLLNSESLFAPTLDGRLGRRMDARGYGIKDFSTQLRDILPRLSHGDVNAAIRKYLDFDDVFIAVVTGDAAGLREALAAEAKQAREFRDGDRPWRSFPATDFFRRPGLPAPDK